MRGLTAGVLCLLLIVAASPASAQLERGKIAGFVKDQSGAVVPGATVTAVNVETRLKRSVVSDATGYYVFPALAPGAYDVEVELEGFKKGVQTGVRLDASANMSVDFTLETGAISEAVTVTAEVTPLQTDSTIQKDRRSEGHRAALVPGPQPARRGRAQGGRRRRQLQQPGVRGVQQRRLQHQRQPSRREHDLQRRRGRDPHALVGNHHRDP